MSETNNPNQETPERTESELKELVAGWEQTLDAIEQELDQKNEAEGNED